MSKRWLVLLVEMCFVSLATQRRYMEYAEDEGKASAVLETVANSEILKFGALENARSILDQIVRGRSHKMLQAALEYEANAFLELDSTHVSGDGSRFVVCKGYMPRDLVTDAGSLEIQPPRIYDKSSDS